MSPCRRVIRRRMMALADELGPQKRVLEVGIAGDDPPGANREFFKAETYKTADINAALAPDYVFDLTKVPPYNCGTWDLVVCSQVLEHVWDIHAATCGLFLLTRPSGCCIVDLPFFYPPHDDMGGGDDYWRLTPVALKRLLHRAGFGRVDAWIDEECLVVGALARREFVR